MSIVLTGNVKCHMTVSKFKLEKKEIKLAMFEFFS